MFVLARAANVPRMRRRSFLVAGVAGSALLAVAGWWTVTRRLAPASLAPETDAIVRAIVPAMLAGALPAAAPDRAKAIEETVANATPQGRPRRATGDGRAEDGARQQAGDGHATS